MSKILTVAVGAGAYVLGAKAGRERYEQILTRARILWRDPRVQAKTSQATDAIKDKVPEVKEQLSGTAKQVADKTKSGSKVEGDSSKNVDARK